MNLITTPLFTKEQCESIIQIGKESIQPGMVHNTYNSNIRNCGISWIPEIETSQWIWDSCISKSNEINHKNYNYKLVMLKNLQFTKYTEGQFFKKHIDKTFDEILVRKLSFTVLLSEPNSYTGGDLCLYEEYTGGDLSLYENSPKTMVPNIQGSINFFSSTVLHEVLPVTSGTRYSLVGWVLGID
jgi:PKHD-type hydroxylase